MKNWPRHLDPMDIRSLLGLHGYCRGFIDGFAYIASPLITLSKKNMKLGGLKHVREASKC